MQHRVTHFAQWGFRFRNFWISLVGLVSITAFVWCFDQVDYLSTKIVLNTASAVVSFAFLSEGLESDPERHRLNWTSVWLALFSIAALLIAIGHEADFPWLVLNIASLIASFPALLVYWKLTQGKLLLKLWLIPIISAALLFWVTLIIPTRSTPELLFLALPVIAYLSVGWELITLLALNRAVRVKKCPKWGPAMECLTMLLLVLPIIVLVMLAVYALQVDDIWVAISGAIIGILFGNAVSEPFGRFVRSLGNFT